MEKTINQIKAAIAAAVGLLTGLWGWLGWLAVGWIGCMALDYITGSMAAAREKGLIRSEGKDYVVQDGDIILFRFNV